MRVLSWSHFFYGGVRNVLSILNRYIIKQVLGATFLVIAVMLVLSFLMTLLGEFQEIGRGEYHFTQAVMYVILRLPHIIYQFSPMLILLGGIIGLGMLTVHQELMIMRGAGFSLHALLKAMLYSALVLILMMLIVGEWLAPHLGHQATIRKQNAKNNGQAVVTTSGIWLHEGNDFFHIERVIGQRHVEGVTRYQFNPNHQLMAAYHAEIMNFHEGKWWLQHVKKTEFLPQMGTKSALLEQDTWDFTLNPSLLNLAAAVPDEMSLTHLFTFSRRLVNNGLQATQFQLAFWQRILQPLAIVVMLFLTIPFILTTPRSSVLGLRLLLGIIVGFIFYLLNAFLGQLSIILQLPPFLAAAMPILLFSAINYQILRRLR